MTAHISHFKEKLEEEKNRLVASLSEVGRKDSGDQSDWAGKPEDLDAEHSDCIDVADNIEEYESNSAVVSELEIGLQDISEALARIESGTYGVCEVCEGEIEDDRLEANPSARTCKTHINN